MGASGAAMALAVVIGGCGRFGFAEHPDPGVDAIAADATSGDAPSGDAPACTSVGELADTFDGALSPSWHSFADTGVGVMQSNGTVVVTLADSVTGTHYGGYASSCRYDVRNQHTFVEILGLPRPMVGDEIDLLWELDGSNRLGFSTTTGSVVSYTVIGGSFTAVASIPFNPVQHRYWQLREAAGMVFWETSPDAATWAPLGTMQAPFVLSSIQVALSSGTYMPVAMPGTAIYGHFDLP